jgi:hypothetical protein
VDSTQDFLVRAQTGDASLTAGRFARVGNLTAAACSLRARITGYQLATTSAGLFCRYVDSNNYLLVRLVYVSGLFPVSKVELVKRVAGTFTVIGTNGSTFLPAWVDGWNDVEVSVDTTGQATVKIGSTTNINLTDSDLATGGTLATGGFGVYHANTAAASNGEVFDNVEVSGLTSATLTNPVVFSSRTVDLTHQAAVSASSDGTKMNRTPIVEGNYLKLPPSTRNLDKHRIVVRARRNDVDAGFADTGLDDDLTATVKATPKVTLE